MSASDLFLLLFGIAAIVACIALLVRLRRLRRTFEQTEGEAQQFRARAEDELSRQREFLETLMTSIPDQIYFKDLESRFIKVNPSVARILGVKTPEEAVGKTDADFFRKQDSQAFRNDDLNVVATGKPLLDRLESAVVSGELRWLSTSKAPILDKQGKAVGLVGISRDITERKRAEEALAGIVASARCILWDARVTGSNGKYDWNLRLYDSDLTRKEYGLERLPGESDGAMWVKHLSPNHLEKMYAVSTQALVGGADGYQQEIPFRAADGSERWLREDVKIKRVGPNEYHLVGVNVDVTERKRAEEALAGVVDGARCILWDARATGADGKYVWRLHVYTSDQTRQEYGLERLPGETDEAMWGKHLSPDHLERMHKISSHALDSGASGYQQEIPFLAADGNYRWLREDVKIKRVDEREFHLVGVCVDITESKLMEDELARERDLLQALMDNVPDNIYFKDAQSRFIRINTHQAFHVGLNSPQEAVGKTDYDFFPEDRAKEFHQDEREVLAGRRIVGKVEQQTVPGQAERWTLTSKVPFHDGDGKVIGLVGVSKDITNLKRMERQLAEANERLRKLAREDPLTGLLNRRMFLTLADNEWARWKRYGKEFSVLVIDADNFKSINDRFGHPAGDQALKVISAMLKKTVREVDTVGRYGGEEFVVLMPETTLDGALAAGEKVLQNMRAAQINLDHGAAQLTVSIGAATAEKDDKDFDALLQRADQAMYAAKRNGKDQLVLADAQKSACQP